MQEPTIVIVSGLPATGKTTLARKIGQGLGLPVFCKDDVKELIATATGANDPSIKGLGTASHSILFYITKQLLGNNLSLVIEGNFKDTKHTQEFIQYLKRSNKKTVEIQCVSDYDVRVERYKSRDRHSVHPTLDDPEYAESFKRDTSFSLGIGKLLQVNTSDFSTVDYQSILDFVIQ